MTVFVGNVVAVDGDVVADDGGVVAVDGGGVAVDGGGIAVDGGVVADGRGIDQLFEPSQLFVGQRAQVARISGYWCTITDALNLFNLFQLPAEA